MLSILSNLFPSKRTPHVKSPLAQLHAKVRLWRRGQLLLSSSVVVVVVGCSLLRWLFSMQKSKGLRKMILWTVNFGSVLLTPVFCWCFFFPVCWRWQKSRQKSNKVETEICSRLGWTAAARTNVVVVVVVVRCADNDERSSFFVAEAEQIEQIEAKKRSVEGRTNGQTSAKFATKFAFELWPSRSAASQTSVSSTSGRRRDAAKIRRYVVWWTSKVTSWSHERSLIVEGSRFAVSWLVNMNA